MDQRETVALIALSLTTIVLVVVVIEELESLVRWAIQRSQRSKIQRLLIESSELCVELSSRTVYGSLSHKRGSKSHHIVDVLEQAKQRYRRRLNLAKKVGLVR